LKIGLTLASFQLLGTMPSSKDFWYIRASGLAIWGNYGNNGNGKNGNGKLGNGKLGNGKKGNR